MGVETKFQLMSWSTGRLVSCICHVHLPSCIMWYAMCIVHLVSCICMPPATWHGRRPHFRLERVHGFVLACMKGKHWPASSSLYISCFVYMAGGRTHVEILPEHAAVVDVAVSDCGWSWLWLFLAVAISGCCCPWLRLLLDVAVSGCGCFWLWL